MDAEIKVFGGIFMVAALFFISITPIGGQEAKISNAFTEYRENAKVYETISLTVGQSVPNFRQFKPVSRTDIIKTLQVNQRDTLEDRNRYFNVMDNLTNAQQKLITTCKDYEKGDWHFFYDRKSKYIEICKP